MFGALAGVIVSALTLIHFNLLGTTVGSILFVTITLPLASLTSWHAGLLMFPRS